MTRPIFLTRTQRLRPILVRIAGNLFVLALFALIGALIGLGF